MPDIPTIYQKLPGVGGRGIQIVRLWQGPDHILMVSSSVLGERYKRFYFADIQSIIIRKTNVWLAWNIVGALSLGICTLAGFEMRDSVTRGGFLCAALIIFIILAIHAAFGPTCECKIRTAVQTEELASANRVRAAEKLLARVRPLIEAAQQTQPAQNPATP